MNNLKERFFLGYPCNFNNLCYVFPPTVKDIIANEHYAAYAQLMSLSQEEIQDLYIEHKVETKKYPTPLEYLLQNAYQNKDVERLVKEGFRFYTHEDVTILYDKKIIILGDLKELLKTVKKVEQLPMINESNYFDFQNLIRAAVGQNPIEAPNPNEDPRITRMKAKARYRDRVKAKQNSNKVTMLNSFAAICCMGIGITPFNLGDLTYVALQELSQKYSQKDSYFLQMQARMNAFSKAKSAPPKYWVADEINN